MKYRFYHMVNEFGTLNRFLDLLIAQLSSLTFFSDVPN